VGKGIRRFSYDRGKKEKMGKVVAPIPTLSIFRKGKGKKGHHRSRRGGMPRYRGSFLPVLEEREKAGSCGGQSPSGTASPRMRK